MRKVVVRSFAVSLDGFSAGPRQDLQNPLGVRGPELMEWFFPTRVWRTMQGQGDGETGTDNRMAELGFQDLGAWILGRNMFGPVRGPWPDASWRGWWGEEPPYHVPTFVLTHYARDPLAMKGNTTFRPVLLGEGEKLFDGIDARALGYEVADTVAGERATHVFLRKRA
jgi:dihydrofolate reductase